MKFHSTLNRDLFEKEELRPEVKSRLVGVAHAFMDFAEIPTDAVKDIRVVGSSASFNYNKYSDIDLHLVVDYKDISKDSKLVTNYLWAVKQLFNSERDIKIRGAEVEVYTEPVGQEAISNGIYSLNKGWIKKPEKIAPTTNDAAVLAKFTEIKEAIEHVQNGDEAKEILNKIYAMRKAGLTEEGEYSTENLAFKKLRNEGLLDKLRQITRVDLDRELSLESLQENKEEDKMEKVNELIFRLMGLKEAFYSIHYRNTSYNDHILAQRLYESIDDDIIDSLKEQIMLADRQLPLQANEYLKGAMQYTIEVTDDSRNNWISAWGKVDDLRQFVNSIKTDNRAFNAICDEIAGNLATASALIYIQTRVTPGMNEELIDEEVKHDHEASVETPIDRKEYKEQVTADEEVEEKVEKQSNEAAAMCEEAVSALDRVTERIKELGL